MNLDEVKNAITVISTAIFALLTGLGIVNADVAGTWMGALTALFTAFSAAIPAVLTLVGIVVSIWQHFNMKKVPENARVTLPASTAIYDSK